MRERTINSCFAGLSDKEVLLIMLIKIINSSIIVAASALIGRELAHTYVKRTQVLSSLQGALSRLETEIVHYASRLPEAMMRIGESIGGASGKLFYLTGQLLTERKSLTVSDAWHSSLEQNKEVLSLQREDLDILQRFGDQLGSSDKEGQIKFIKLTLMQLHEEELKARALREKYEKMYRSLGLLAGIALAVILL